MTALIIVLLIAGLVWLTLRQAKLNRVMREMGDGPEGSGPYVGPNYAGPPE